MPANLNTIQCKRLRVENVSARMSEEELDLVERLAAERGVSRRTPSVRRSGKVPVGS